MPVYEAFYVDRGEPRKAGDYQLVVKDGFWLVRFYNKDDYFEKNEFDSYSINNLTAKPNEDGFVTLNFGMNSNGKDNFL